MHDRRCRSNHQSKFRVFAAGLVVVCLCGAATVWGWEAPRDQQQPAIKSDVRIVLVDVVVTEAKGQPASGLKKEDFQISEDGKAQTVSFFEEHTDGKVTPVALPEMPPDVFTNYPTVKTTDSVNVLLLDSLNTQAIDQVYVRPQMEKYMEAAIAAPNGARLAIFTLGQQLRMIRGFTADSAKSLDAMEDPKSHTEAKFEPQLATPARKESEALGCAKIKSPAGKEACKVYMAQVEGDRAADRVAMTLQAFQALARYLAPIPGRKNIMWVAGSFPIHFFPDTGRRGQFASPYPSAVRQTAELLTADQVAVYPIGASALSGESYLQGNSDPSANRTGKAVEGDETDRAFNQIAMELLARDTGGRAFYNTNGLSEAMAQAVDEGSHFYSLAYVPSNSKMDGKYRKIDLKVAGDYKLAYRRGYYAENAKFPVSDAGPKKNDALVPLMGFGMPDFAQILYKVRVAPVEDASNGLGGAKELKTPTVRYGLDFAITPADLHLETGPDGIRRGNIEVMLVAYDADGGVVNVFRKKSEIILDPQMYAEVMRIGLQMHREIDVPENAAYLRTGLMDLDSGKLGSLTVEMRSKTAMK
ncbi:MAG TPA: VWA domain-containing protein [Candidatus Sulfotelmatobacter sp.]|nr:VWA domain-containing protein [Candidatus Sulfotelmatobacter sp.]